jgi:hypothetical protein
MVKPSRAARSKPILAGRAVAEDICTDPSSSAVPSRPNIWDRHARKKGSVY